MDMHDSPEYVGMVGMEGGADAPSLDWRLFGREAELLSRIAAAASLVPPGFFVNGRALGRYLEQPSICCSDRSVLDVFDGVPLPAVVDRELAGAVELLCTGIGECEGGRMLEMVCNVPRIGFRGEEKTSLAHKEVSAALRRIWRKLLSHLLSLGPADLSLDDLGPFSIHAFVPPVAAPESSRVCCRAPAVDGREDSCLVVPELPGGAAYLVERLPLMCSVGGGGAGLSEASLRRAVEGISHLQSILGRPFEARCLVWDEGFRVVELAPAPCAAPEGWSLIEAEGDGIVSPLLSSVVGRGCADGGDALSIGRGRLWMRADALSAVFDESLLERAETVTAAFDDWLRTLDKSLFSSSEVDAHEILRVIHDSSRPEELAGCWLAVESSLRGSLNTVGRLLEGREHLMLPVMLAGIGETTLESLSLEALTYSSGAKPGGAFESVAEGDGERGMRHCPFKTSRWKGLPLWGLDPVWPRIGERVDSFGGCAARLLDDVELHSRLVRRSEQERKVRMLHSSMIPPSWNPFSWRSRCRRLLSLMRLGIGALMELRARMVCLAAMMRIAFLGETAGEAADIGLMEVEELVGDTSGSGGSGGHVLRMWGVEALIDDFGLALEARRRYRDWWLYWSPADGEEAGSCCPPPREGVMRGLGVSVGSSCGVLVGLTVDYDGTVSLDYGDAVSPGGGVVLYLERPWGAALPLLPCADAVIARGVSTFSSVAILCREWGIPCVSLPAGAQRDAEMLVPGLSVSVDGYSGEIAFLDER